jgi:hypothetical protein
MVGYESTINAPYQWIQIELPQPIRVSEVVVHRMTGTKSLQVRFVDLEVRVGLESVGATTGSRIAKNEVCATGPLSELI